MIRAVEMIRAVGLGCTRNAAGTQLPLRCCLAWLCCRLSTQVALTVGTRDSGSRPGQMLAGWQVGGDNVVTWLRVWCSMYDTHISFQTIISSHAFQHSKYAAAPTLANGAHGTSRS